MPGKTAIEVLVQVHGLIGIKRLEFPSPVALLGRVLDAPACALFHDHVSEKLSIPIVRQGDYRAARDRLPILYGIDCGAICDDLLFEVAARTVA